ncbi:MAG: hypothetical protein HQ402_03560 [Parcubacteria group bacterium]|nr:hypothetical protein [Parcubacteria group bacterium]
MKKVFLLLFIVLLFVSVTLYSRNQNRKQNYVVSWKAYTGEVDEYWVGIFDEVYSKGDEIRTIHIRLPTETTPPEDIVLIYKNKKLIYFSHLKDGEEITNPKKAFGLLEKAVKKLVNKKHNIDNRLFQAP